MCRAVRVVAAMGKVDHVPSEDGCSTWVDRGHARRHGREESGTGSNVLQHFCSIYALSEERSFIRARIHGGPVHESISLVIAMPHTLRSAAKRSAGRTPRKSRFCSAGRPT